MRSFRNRTVFQYHDRVGYDFVRALVWQLPMEADRVSSRPMNSHFLITWRRYATFFCLLKFSPPPIATRNNFLLSLVLHPNLLCLRNIFKPHCSQQTLLFINAPFAFGCQVDLTWPDQVFDIYQESSNRFWNFAPKCKKIALQGNDFFQ